HRREEDRAPRLDRPLASWILEGGLDPDRTPAPARLRHPRSEEHTSELQSLTNLVCRLLLEKKRIREQRGARRGGPSCMPADMPDSLSQGPGAQRDARTGRKSREVSAARRPPNRARGAAVSD